MPLILAQLVAVPFKKLGFRVSNGVGSKAFFGLWRKLSALEHLGGGIFPFGSAVYRAIELNKFRFCVGIPIRSNSLPAPCGLRSHTFVLCSTMWAAVAHGTSCNPKS